MRTANLTGDIRGRGYACDLYIVPERLPKYSYRIQDTLESCADTDLEFPAIERTFVKHVPVSANCIEICDLGAGIG